MLFDTSDWKEVHNLRVATQTWLAKTYWVRSEILLLIYRLDKYIYINILHKNSVNNQLFFSPFLLGGKRRVSAYGKATIRLLITKT
jgi:hypothetical protein